MESMDLSLSNFSGSHLPKVQMQYGTLINIRPSSLMDLMAKEEHVPDKLNLAN